MMHEAPDTARTVQTTADENSGDPIIWGSSIRARPYTQIQRIAWVIQLVISTIIFTAAVTKLLDMRNFSTELTGWSIIPGRLAPWLAVIVTTFEFVLPLLWLRWTHALPVIAMILLLTIFTIAYCVESAIASPPNCACFGRILSYEQHRSGLAPLLTRNGALILALAASIVLPRITPARIQG